MCSCAALQAIHGQAVCAWMHNEKHRSVPLYFHACPHGSRSTSARDACWSCCKVNRTDHPCFQVQVLWEGLQDEVSKSALSQAQLLSGHCAQQCLSLPCFFPASCVLPRGNTEQLLGTLLFCAVLSCSLAPATCCGESPHCSCRNNYVFITKAN